MAFSQPMFVYMTLLMIPLVIGLVFWITWQRRRDQQQLGTSKVVQQLMQPFSQGRRIMKGVLLTIGLLLASLALAGPQYGAKMVEVHRQGVEVVIAIDVSKSMLAEDIKPNRLTRAKQELSALIDQLQGDRVGVIAFAGEATVACPLTTDYTAAKMFLSYLAPEQIPLPGTNLGTAIDTAMTMYASGSEGYRVLVLLTDGEDHEKTLMNKAEQAQQAGIKILSIGFGSPSGEPIPIKNQQGTLVGYVKDSQGKTVVSKLDEQTLQQLTKITKGIYVPAHQGLLEAQRLAEHIDTMQKQNISSGQYGASEDRYQFLLLPALIFLLMGFWLPIRKKAWLWTVLLCWFFATPVWAGPAEDVNRGNRYYKQGEYESAVKKYRDAQIKRPEEPIIYYNLGNSLHQQEKYEDAQKNYEKALATKNKKLKAQTYYNLGNNHFKQQNYEEAVKAYKQALKLNPKDEDSLYNLSQALLIKKNPEQQQKKKNKPGEQKQQDQAAAAKQKQDDKDEQSDQDNRQNGQAEQKNGDDDKGEKKAGDQFKPAEDEANEDAAPLPKPGQMSKEDAKNLLESIREAERKTQQERLKEKSQQQKKQGKEDW